eukprot:2265036-Karenia_brevis.AAC.1
MVEEAHNIYNRKFTNLFEAAEWVEKGKKQRQGETPPSSTLNLRPKKGVKSESTTPGRSSSVDQEEEDTAERREKEIR